MTKKTKVILTIFGLLPLIAFLVYGYLYPSPFFTNQENLRSFIKGYGVWAPLVLIIIQIVQVIITPFSHYAVGIAGGFIFGTWYGFIYNYIGRVIGHTVAFYLSRNIGRRLVVKFVKPETLEKYDRFWDKGGSFVLFLIYYLPLFPDDEISYIAGTSRMKFVPFLVANLLGQIGGSLGLAYIGSGMKMETTTTAIVFFPSIILALVFSIIWWKKDRVSDSSPKIDSKLNW